jgi:DNA-binding NarL/FixJ family response regulator
MNRSLQQDTDKSAVLIIDSLELRRAGVVSFLTPWADDSNIRIVQIDPAEALKQPNNPVTKLIVLVIGAGGVAESLPETWLVTLQEKYSNVPLVFVSEREEPEEIVAAFKAGARGFIPMSAPPPVAVQAFTFIMSGGSFWCRSGGGWKMRAA